VLGGRTPTVADLPNLRYTSMVIDESMRLYPPAWSVGRSPIADDEIMGFNVPKGSADAQNACARLPFGASPAKPSSFAESV